MVCFLPCGDHRCRRTTGGARSALRDELGFAAGTELELAAVNGALEVRVPSRVRVEDGPHGLHFVADGADELTDEHVRELIEKSRR